MEMPTASPCPKCQEEGRRGTITRRTAIFANAGATFNDPNATKVQRSHTEYECSNRHVWQAPIVPPPKTDTL